ncbi:MAG: ATP-binding protein [Bifidobacteriaceae bacterium]|jgi:hypothetical protein|nr:ATP-binding protein [Bifidobacteriaceae bacterium]
MGNPFTPTFGSQPLFLAGRHQVIDDVLEGLDNRPGDPNRSTLFVGPRGSGKTVLLARVSEAAQRAGWVAARVTATPGMSERLLEQIRRAGAEFLGPVAKSRLTSLNVSGVGFSREVETATATWGYRFTELVEKLNSQGVGVLVAVDEVNVDTPDMIGLATEYQQMVTDRRDVALLMAGLPGKVGQMLRSDTVSFLRRAFRRQLGAVTIQDAAEAIERTLLATDRRIEPVALNMAAATSEGYPFLIQLVGYHLWRSAREDAAIGVRDAERASLAAQADMDRMILDNTIHELSKKDLAFLVAMTEDGDESSMGDIAKRMGASPSLAGKYRRRLMDQGLIADSGYGRVRFELPMLRRYAAANVAR